MGIGKLFLNVALAASTVIAGPASAFEVYGFIPYQSRLENGTLFKGAPDQAWFMRLGIKPIHVVYDNKILVFPRSKNSKNNARLSSEKVRDVANSSRDMQVNLVSLDMESWDRFDFATPDKILEAIRLYRDAHPDAVVGLYATVPQNTYAWSKDKVNQYDEINARYSKVADAVDYLSPSLYNYNGADFSQWLEGAKYNIEAARRYSSSKKIYPYITPEVRVGGATRWLSYDEMAERLQALRELGADGCIVWASSRSRDSSGEAPVLDPAKGWLKAVSDAAAQRYPHHEVQRDGNSNSVPVDH